MNKIFSTFIIALCIAGAGFGARRSIDLVSPPRTIFLPDSFIVAGSETLFCGGENRRIPRDDYEIDPLRGQIAFIDSLPCESLRVVYTCIENVSFPLSIQHAVPRGSGGMLLERRPRRNMAMIPENSRLVHSGSLLRGIEIGSRRDATMESAFQLEAFGAIGEDVEVTASLSDQDLPIQPEGTSEKLSQLDQVHIGVKGPFFAANFGDFSTTFAPGEFTNYTRRLSGVQLKAFNNDVSAEAVGAVLEGIWASDDFRGIEGNQGPYPITAGGGHASIQILAGTETVWLNGEKARRGQNNDYTIDYNLGQITFTPNRPIGADDRIVVDFQYTDLEFRRSFYGVTGGLQPFEGLEFTFAGMTETDDPNAPLNMDFDDEEYEKLSAAGDCADSAFILTATLSDSGAYILADSASDSSHFEWVGDGEGAWDVDFSHVGIGEGDYNFVSEGRYEWVGEGEGSYRPIRLLPMPASHALLDIGANLTIADGVVLAGEIAASALDRNRLSDIGDDDNDGQAYNIALDAKRELSIAGRSFGALEMKGRYRRKGERFATIGRLDDAEFQRDWGFDNASGDEQLGEATATYSPWDFLGISGSYGANSIGAQSSRRVSSALELDTDNWDASANYSRTTSDARWDRLWGESGGKLWIFSPKVDARFEDKANEFRFHEVSTDIAVSPAERFSITPGFEFRHDETRNSTGASSESETKTYRIAARLFGWNVLANHREFTDSIGASSNSDLGRIEGAIKLKRNNLRLRYELSREQSELLEPVYEYVGSGAGNYDFDPDRNEYIPVSGGEYLRKYLPTGDFTPAIGSDLRANIALSFSDLGGNAFFVEALKALSFDGLLRSEGENKSTKATSFLLDPRGMLDDEELLSGQFLAEGNLRIGSRRSKGVTFRRRYNKVRNAQWTTGEEIRWSNDYTVEGRYELSRIGNLRGSVEWSRRARLYPDDSGANDDLSGTEFSLFWNRMIGDKLQLTANTAYLEQANLWPPSEPTRIERFAAEPGATFYLKKGSIRASVGYARVASDDASERILPYDMAHGDYIGDNGHVVLSANLSVATGTMLNLSYELRSRSRYLPEHTASASVQLTF